MTVWLLFTGTEYEDYGVSQVYASEDEALKGAKEHMESDHEPEYGEWEQQPLLKELAGVRCAKHMWFRGNDRLWLTPYPVQGIPPGETVSSGWAFRTESGDYLRVVFTDEGGISDYEAVPLEKAQWMSHDTFMSWTQTTIKEAEKKLGRLKPVPFKITCRREVTDG